MSLFHRRSQSPRERLFYIEINDAKIDQQITKLIVIMQRKIAEFRRNLDETNMTVKEEILNELYTLMVGIKTKIKILKLDVDKVMNLEFQNKEYFAIKDQSYVTDKRMQLEKIEKVIQKFIDVAEQKPSAEALRTELIQQLVNEIDTIDVCTKSIISDDYHLEQIYKQIMQV